VGTAKKKQRKRKKKKVVVPKYLLCFWILCNFPPCNVHIFHITKLQWTL
jgi:hypothetical protein